MQLQSDTVLRLFDKLGTIKFRWNALNSQTANAIVEYDAKMRLLTETLNADLHSILTQSLLPIWYEIINSREYTYDLQKKTKNQMIKENKSYVLQKDKASIGKFYKCYRTFKAVSISVQNEEKEPMQWLSNY